MLTPSRDVAILILFPFCLRSPPSLPPSLIYPAQWRLCAGNPSCRLYFFILLVEATGDAQQRCWRIKRRDTESLTGEDGAYHYSSDQNKLTRMEPETHAALGRRHKIPNLPSLLAADGTCVKRKLWWRTENPRKILDIFNQ